MADHTTDTGPDHTTPTASPVPPEYGEPGTHEVVSFIYGHDGRISTVARDGSLRADGGTERIGPATVYRVERRAAGARFNVLLDEIRPLIGDTRATAIDKLVGEIEIATLMEAQAAVVRAILDSTHTGAVLLLVEGSEAEA